MPPTEKKAPTRRRKKTVEPASRGLTPAQSTAGEGTARLRELRDAVAADGGATVGMYRDPLGGNWQLVVVLPVDKVVPTPFQRDLSESHVKRLTEAIGALDRFLDPIVAVRADDGSYWTPNGHHRLAAMRSLGGRSITALLVPETEMAYRILALNTEKAHNLREKALEVIRMARDLAQVQPVPEAELASLFEEPQLLTLGICYERKGRFAGGAYQPVLRRIDGFLRSKLPQALTVRESRADALFALDAAVGEAIAALKERGFESPYLRNFVVARVNPLRFQRGAKADFDETVEKMTRAAKRFNAGKVDAESLARAGGAPEE
jgi:ParB family chromosome partitioning protein